MIRVLVVDDSAVVRKVLTDELTRGRDVEVIAAVDPYDARDKILRFTPDVITLDIEMPRMDGLSFLRRLMEHHPLPVVVVSSLTPQNSEAALRALELGAVDVIGKPASTASLRTVAGPLLRAVRAAAAANVTRLVPPDDEEPPVPLTVAKGACTRRHVVAVGASTGGPVAIEQILAAMPASAPGIVIVQHMPVGFTAAFARRLNDRCAIEVREAADRDVVSAGVALIAPGGAHLVMTRTHVGLQVRVRKGPPVHFQRPAVDVLFHSIAQCAGRDAVGVLLTGMGSDGASGMRALRDAGAHTIAQDEATCVVYSMPSEAIRFGGATEVMPLPRIAAAALAAVARPEQRLAPLRSRV